MDSDFPNDSSPAATRRRLLRGAGGLSAALALPSWVQAQEAWPARPINLVVPFPSGGGTDTFARPFATTLTKNLGKQVIVDNRGGAGGTVGAGIAAKAAPDGYTFFMGAVHHAIAPAVYPKLEYNFETDFIPVGLISSVPQVIVVSPRRVQAENLKALLEYLRKSPGRLNYGSAGNGTSHHLAGELFKLLTNTFITHIPYRGSGPALQDLVAGQVDMMFDGLASSATHIRSNRIRALAVAAPRRAPGFPNSPTAAEAGVPGYDVSTWYGLFAPKGTPKEIVERMQAEMAKVLAAPEVREIWTGLGAEQPNLYGDAFGRFVAGEVRRWRDVVKKSGVKLE